MCIAKAQCGHWCGDIGSGVGCVDRTHRLPARKCWDIDSLRSGSEVWAAIASRCWADRWSLSSAPPFHCVFGWVSVDRRVRRNGRFGCPTRWPEWPEAWIVAFLQCATQVSALRLGSEIMVYQSVAMRMECLLEPIAQIETRIELMV